MKFEADGFDSLRIATLAGIGLSAVPMSLLPPGAPPVTAFNLPSIPDVELFLKVQPEAAEHTKMFADVLGEVARAGQTPT